MAEVIMMHVTPTNWKLPLVQRISTCITRQHSIRASAIRKHTAFSSTRKEKQEVTETCKLRQLQPIAGRLHLHVNPGCHQRTLKGKEGHKRTMKSRHPAESSGFWSPRRLASGGLRISNSGSSLECQWIKLADGMGHDGRVAMSAGAALLQPPVWALLTGCAAFGQVAEQRTQWGSQVSAALLAMASAALLTTAGVLPSSSLIYSVVWQELMPLAVALSLLETDVRQAFTDAGDTMRAFWMGAAGTVVGTLVAFALLRHRLGPHGWKMAACMCASYIGGSINYAATAQALQLGPAGGGGGGLLAAGMAADNLLMALYFAALMALPDRWPGSHPPQGVDHSSNSSAAVDQVSSDQSTAGGEQADAGSEGGEGMRVGPTVESLAVSLSAAAAACALGRHLAARLPPAFAGVELGATALFASAFSALAATLQSGRAGDDRREAGCDTSQVAIFAGAESMGSVLMLVFFSVIGATAGIREAVTAGSGLLAFGFVLLAVHLAVILGLGRLAGLPLPAVLVASNANVGGPATAAAMACTRSWPHLVRAGLVTGTLGYTVGTAIACLLALRVLRPLSLLAPFSFLK
eukprot:jgi/Mesen1/5990/ME000304S05004